MIGKIAGRLLEKHPPQIVVDVHGIGYELDVPMSTFYSLPATGAEVSLYTHLVVREDAHQLYGFATEAERHAFRQRSEEHTSELQSPCNLVCRLLLERE